MRKLFALAAVSVVWSSPVTAQEDRPDRNCGYDPVTTGALSTDPRSLHLPGDAKPDRVEVTPPKESWQEEFQQGAERRRHELLACGVD